MNEPKQVCKNIHSGKCFLFIEETNDEKLLLVIPTGEVRPLNASLFEDIEEVNITDLLNNGLITQQQIDGYKKFMEEDLFRLLEEIIRSAEGDLPNKLRIAQKRMSKEQFEFVFDRWASEVMERASEIRERRRRDNKTRTETS